MTATEKKNYKNAGSEMDKYSVRIKQLIEGDRDEKTAALNKLAGLNNKIEDIVFVEENGVASLVANMRDGSIVPLLDDFEGASNKNIASILLTHKTIPMLTANAQLY